MAGKSKAKRPGTGRPTKGRAVGRSPQPTLKARAANVRLLALDVDGVLTDGSIMLDDLGNETKRFNVRDGLGIATWLRMNLEVAIVTRRCGKAVDHRMKELGIKHVIQGSMDKGEAIDELTRRTGIPPTDMAFVGDDWPDLAALRKVGFPIAVADADERVKKLAILTTTARGGHGAVREAIEHLLASKGMLQAAIGLF